MNRYTKYNRSPKGKIRSASANLSKKHKLADKKWRQENSDYLRHWRERADALLGVNYGVYWGAYKLIKELPNATVVEITV